MKQRMFESELEVNPNLMGFPFDKVYTANDPELPISVDARFIRTAFRIRTRKVFIRISDKTFDNAKPFIWGSDGFLSEHPKYSWSKIRRWALSFTLEDVLFEILGKRPVRGKSNTRKKLWISVDRLQKPVDSTETSSIMETCGEETT